MEAVGLSSPKGEISSIVVKNREKVKDWYNKNADRKIASVTAWVATHRKQRNEYLRKYRHRQRLKNRPICGTLGCNKKIELGQRVFCIECSTVHKSWRGNAKVHA